MICTTTLAIFHDINSIEVIPTKINYQKLKPLALKLTLDGEELCLMDEERWVGQQRSLEGRNKIEQEQGKIKATTREAHADQ